MSMVQMQWMVARECISDSLLQHYAHVWLKWVFFCYNKITHTTNSYKVYFHVVWWFVDENVVFYVRDKVYWVVMIEWGLRHIEESSVSEVHWGSLWTVHFDKMCHSSYPHFLIAVLWITMWEFVINFHHLSFLIIDLCFPCICFHYILMCDFL